MRRREERFLKRAEEEKQRAASLQKDGESTSVREDRWETTQLMESTQPETTQMVAADEGEEAEEAPPVAASQEEYAARVHY